MVTYNVSLENKVVLVTGAAGFIGANLVKRLLNEFNSVKVIGIDSITEYYDVRLKYERLQELSAYGDRFVFIKDSIAKKEIVESIFTNYHPQVVVNLAAQAGVRYSITNPDAYIESNLIGFYNILEACRHHSVEHLVYASSSSVYGSNKKVPYSTDDKVDNPVSLYAATKKSNELMAHAYSKLYNIALTGDADCGGLLSYNYISGEPVTGLAEGRPLFVRSANDKFNLANFMRSHLYASVGVLKIGNDILFNEEKIKVDRITGHGGLFKTKGVGQRILAAAINSPISVMETAGEGGAWGIALLGSYLVNNEKKQSLADFLDEKVFVGDAGIEVSPTAEDVAGFNTYIENYKAGLPIEEAAVKFK